jgi:hypothetical protein
MAHSARPRKAVQMTQLRVSGLVSQTRWIALFGNRVGQFLIETRPPAMGGVRGWAGGRGAYSGPEPAQNRPSRSGRVRGVPSIRSKSIRLGSGRVLRGGVPPPSPPARTGSVSCWGRVPSTRPPRPLSLPGATVRASLPIHMCLAAALPLPRQQRPAWLWLRRPPCRFLRQQAPGCRSSER